MYQTTPQFCSKYNIPIFKIICYIDEALEGEIYEKVLKTIKGETLKFCNL